MKENKLYDFISMTLKGISQVILIENSLSGLIILIAIAISNYQLGIVALVSALIGTLIGHVAGADKTAVEKGIFGYNSVLVALALSLYLTGHIRWGIAFIGAAFATIITGAMIYFLKDLKIPVLTFPYIMLTWFFLLASYHLKIFKLSSELAPQNLSQWKLSIQGSISLIDGLVNGVSQVYFLNNLWTGILILIAVFWGNWRLGAYAVLGAGIGLLTAYALQANHMTINLGLYGYNAVLTILALFVFGDKENPFSLVTGCIAAMTTVPITAGIHTLLLPYGLPTLTMPFVLVTWIFIGAGKVLKKL